MPQGDGRQDNYSQPVVVGGEGRQEEAQALPAARSGDMNDGALAIQNGAKHLLLLSIVLRPTAKAVAEEA